jgi:threonyl-tRNA synthetase
LGDTENDSLQRMYGISFPDKKMLKVWKENQEKVCRSIVMATNHIVPQQQRSIDETNESHSRSVTIMTEIILSR